MSLTPIFNVSLTFDIYQKDLVLFPLHHDQQNSRVRNFGLNTADHILVMYRHILISQFKYTLKKHLFKGFPDLKELPVSVEAFAAIDLKAGVCLGYR